jgi:hypothetical protein
MRRWLWLVSVGATDIQFPAWQQDETGAWTHLRRVDVGRSKEMRRLHEALIWLGSGGYLTLSADVPKTVEGKPPISVRIEQEEIDGEPMYAIALEPNAAPVCRISPTGYELPNAHEGKLQLFFPKVTRLVSAINGARGADPITVVVLNTRRTEGRMEAKEPVAAGPLVARFIAQQLAVELIDGGQKLTGMLPDNTCTWLDILQGQETLEDPAIEAALPSRLNAVLTATALKSGDRVVISTAGGLPGLKAIIERIPAIYVGLAAISVLDDPENAGSQRPELRPLAEKWADRETLRFHCAQALRDGDYASAYGVARRRLPAAWATAVVRGIGPLIELPTLANAAQVRPFDRFKPFELRAVRIEAALVMGDALQAIRQLHTFIESVTWTILRRSQTLPRLGLTVSLDEEVIFCRGRPLPDGLHELLSQEQLRVDNYSPSGGSIFRGSLAGWLLEREADPHLKISLCALIKTVDCYRSRSNRQVKDGLNDLRNAFSHGAGLTVDPTHAQKRMLGSGLAQSVGEAFGSNFLAVDHVRAVISGLRSAGAPNLEIDVRRALDEALGAVVRGEG